MSRSLYEKWKTYVITEVQHAPVLSGRIKPLQSTSIARTARPIPHASPACRRV